MKYGANCILFQKYERNLDVMILSVTRLKGKVEERFGRFTGIK